MKIAIIGGGIGGLALASSLKSMNIDFHLFERASAFTEVGAGIGLSESTLQILKKIDLYDLAQKNGKFVENAILAKKDLTTLRKIPTDNDGMCIDRKMLIELLSEKLDSSDYSLNKSLQSFEEKKDKILLNFLSGEQIETKFLIACDGINSSIRKTLYPQIQKRYSGQTIWRGIANISLPEKFKETYFEFWGDNLRFGISPMTNQRYYWYAVKMAKSGERENPEDSSGILKNYFKNYNPIISKIIGKSPKIVRDDMWDLKPHRFPWSKDNIVFLGDSIHATTPNLAQGGCQAIEDGYTLAKCISKYGLTKETFEKYETLRRKKTTYVVNKSWQFGQSAHSKIPYFIKLNMFLLKNFLPDSFFKRQYQKVTDLKYLEKI